MVYPPYAAPFPDAKAIDITLGTQQRAMLTLMAQKPGHVFTTEELAAKLKLPALTPRRADVLVGGINDVLGEDDHRHRAPAGLDDDVVRGRARHLELLRPSGPAKIGGVRRP